MEAKNQSVGAIFGIFKKLTMQQKMLVGGVGILTVAMLGFVLMLVNETTYSKLYTNLDPEEATRIMEYLETEKIPYTIEGGNTISIPTANINKVKLTLSGKGIPSSGVQGYEIFEGNNIGMSEFMQKLNLKRALEGEIAKTIMQIRSVDKARVSLVIPEKNVFRNEEKETTASVSIKLKSGMFLTQENITAIQHLVASSIEGLSANKVTIIDSKGKLLSQMPDEESVQLSGSKQYEVRGKVESYLSNKAQGILDRVLGYGNSDVKVNVDLDFTQVEKTMETLDPESQVAIGESSTKSTSGGKSISDSNVVNSEQTTTNYEVSKTLEKVIQASGIIKRLTIAAVINGLKEETKGANGTTTKIVSRPQADLDLYQKLISQAVGLDNSRQDVISVVSIPFENQVEEEVVESTSPFGDIEQISNFLIAFVALVIGMFIVKSLMKRLKSQKILIGTVGNFNEEAFNDLMPALDVASVSMPAISKKKRKELLEVGDLEDEISDEAQRKKLETEKIINYVQKNPQDAAKLINSWLREDEY